jgi:hypothetical protein
VREEERRRRRKEQKEQKEQKETRKESKRKKEDENESGEGGGWRRSEREKESDIYPLMLLQGTSLSSFVSLSLSPTLSPALSILLASAFSFYFSPSPPASPLVRSGPPWTSPRRSVPLSFSFSLAPLCLSSPNGGKGLNIRVWVRDAARSPISMGLCLFIYLTYLTFFSIDTITPSHRDAWNNR